MVVALREEGALSAMKTGGGFCCGCGAIKTGKMGEGGAIKMGKPGRTKVEGDGEKRVAIGARYLRKLSVENLSTLAFYLLVLFLLVKFSFGGQVQPWGSSSALKIGGCVDRDGMPSYI